MTPSKFDGKQVLYIDKLNIPHSGVIVGQSSDGMLLVQSDNPKVPKAAWHFKIKPEALPTMLVQPPSA